MDLTVSLNIVKHWQELCNDIIFSDIAPVLIQNKILTVKDYESIKLQPENKAMEFYLVKLLGQDEDVLLKFAEALQRDYSWLAEKIKEGRKVDHGIDETDATPIVPPGIPSGIPPGIPSGEHLQSDSHTRNEHLDLDHNNFTPTNTTQCLNNRIITKPCECERRRNLESKVTNKLLPKMPNTNNKYEIIDPEFVISSSTDVEHKNEEITDEVISVLRKCFLLTKGWTTIAHSLGLTDRIHDIRFKVVLHNEHLSMCIVYLIKEWLEISPKEATLSRLIQVLRSEKFNKVADQLTEKLYAKPVTPCTKIQ